jgi:hypothetical protein
MTGTVGFARHHLLQYPFKGLVALPPEIGGEADPIDMHVDAESRSGRVIGQPALLPAALRQRHAAAAELGGHVHSQVARSLQVSEIFAEEAVLAVINRAPLGEFGEQIGRQDVIVGQHVNLLDAIFGKVPKVVLRGSY